MGFYNEIESSVTFGQANIALGNSNIIGNSTVNPQWGNLLLGAENSSFTNNAWILGQGNIGQERTVTLGTYAATAPDSKLIVGTGIDENNRSNGLVVLNSGAVQIPGNLTLSQTSGITFGNGSTPSISGSANGTITFNTPVNLTTGLQISGGNLHVASATNATSSSTGALTIAGGLGVRTDSWINGIRVGRGGGNQSTNTALGSFALNVNITGTGNTAIGCNSMQATTTGTWNTALGLNSLYYNTTGAYNTAVGSTALSNNETGANNVALGRSAGNFQANGIDKLKDADSSIYIGHNSRGFDNNDNNSIVIGANAVGEGANTTVIGNPSTSHTKIFGTVKAPSGVLSNNFSGDFGIFAGGWTAGYTSNIGHSTVIGTETYVTTELTTAIGGFWYDFVTEDIALNSMDFAGNLAAGRNATALGGRLNEALGESSFAMGNQIITPSAFSTGIGSRNLSAQDPAQYDPTAWEEESPLFELGNGSPGLSPIDATEYSNALTTLKNGQTTLTNKAWKNRDVLLVTATADPSAANTDSEGNALVVEGHTVLKGKVVIEQPQGDISMGAYQ